MIKFEQPQTLNERFNFEIGQEGKSLNDLLSDCETTVEYAVKTGTLI
jgi:hypothetical protein